MNPDKAELLMVVVPSIGGLGNSLSFGGVTLTMISEVHSLGDYLDPALTMEIQVASVIRSAYFHRWLGKLALFWGVDSQREE